MISYANEKIYNIQLYYSKLNNNNNSNFLFLNFKIEQDWHIYWLNPGDAGYPTQIKITSNESINYKILYPTPKYYYDDGIYSIGYDTEVTFPIIIDNINDLEKLNLSLEINALACNEICEPVYIKQNINHKNLIFTENISEFFKTIPIENDNIKTTYKDDANFTKIIIENIPNDLSSIKNIEFYPLTPNLFTYSLKTNYTIYNQQVLITMNKNPLNTNPIKIDGILAIQTNQSTYYFQIK